MKNKLINGRWNMIVPDSIADWDGGTGNYADRQGWEFERFESFGVHLKRGMTFFDVGAEHGWLSAVIAREFVGPENMVLFEPSPEFWTNIRKIWAANELADPKATFPGFVSDATTAKAIKQAGRWPKWTSSEPPEVDAMAYRSLANDSDRVAVTSVTIDDFVKATKIHPDVINVDVEGAEMLVMKGATRTLLEDRPLVWLSVHPDLMLRDFGVEHVEELFEFMHSVGYGRNYLNTDHEQHHELFPLEYVAPDAEWRPS
jgi:FkbM family methyltransferase